MLYTGFDAHKLTNFDQFLVLQAQIWYSDVSVCNELSGKFYTDAQFSTYNMLLEFYLLAAYKWSEVMRTNFLARF